MPDSRNTVLVIDDDPTVRDVLQQIFLTAGFEVLTAPTPAKGLDIIHHAGDNLRAVVLDYHMPGLNGADTLQYLRSLRPNIKIIGLTGVAGIALPDSFRRGVDQLLTKPFSTQHLLFCLHSLLGLTPAPVVVRS